MANPNHRAINQMEKLSRKKDQVLQVEEEEERQEGGRFKCAHILLSYLHPTELASITSSCKTLNHISNCITASRSSDASRGLENLLIPFFNLVNHHPYSYFNYTLICHWEVECGNRLIQRGVCVRLKIVKNGRKSWALRTGKINGSGQFVYEYTKLESTRHTSTLQIGEVP
ncbi:histone-lysine N-methyltransferase SUVR3-like [Camellia sinensis]|uniref:histone-lysine N-methyltransferase SUVR3-like n=1 Tax=Camellia sinensis TaxID=4442 RepID=UPI00103686CE|nr:histone-lysine N-methyltransferase SUVR3-like [Camellia sinensis]